MAAKNLGYPEEGINRQKEENKDLMGKYYTERGKGGLYYVSGFYHDKSSNSPRVIYKEVAVEKKHEPFIGDYLKLKKMSSCLYSCKPDIFARDFRQVEDKKEKFQLARGVLR